MKSVGAPREDPVSQWFGHQATLQRAAWVGLEHVSSLRGGNAMKILPFCPELYLVPMNNSGFTASRIFSDWSFDFNVLTLPDKNQFCPLGAGLLLQFVTRSDWSPTVKWTGEMQRLLTHLILHTCKWRWELDSVKFMKYHCFLSWTCSFLILFSKLS